MLVASFETSTSVGAYAWAEIETTSAPLRATRFASLVAPADPGHAETLLTRLGDLLNTGGHRLEDVELVVFGCGPGTFTGLRIGLATAKGLALANGTALVGLSSLEALALSSPSEGRIATLIDARRKELYAALYEMQFEAGRPRATLSIPEQVVRPEQLATLFAGQDNSSAILYAGNGAERYAEAVCAIGGGVSAERSTPDPLRMAIEGAARFLERGGDDPSALEPQYLREPDARLPKPAF